MKINLLVALLFLSVLFNVFFAAGYVRAKSASTQTATVADPEAVQVARDLNLDEGQRAAFEELRSTLRAEQAVFAESLWLVRQELADELGREQPDLDKVRQIVARESELISQRREAESGRFSAFVGLLNSDQTRKLSQRFGGRGPWRGHGPPPPHGDDSSGEADRFGPPPGGIPGNGPDSRPDGGPGGGGGGGSGGGGRGGRDGRGGPPWARFDVNGDGQLDETERAAARQAMEERMRRERERREEMFEKFDADDDGKLDRDELNAWMRWNFEQGRGRPPGPAPGTGPGPRSGSGPGDRGPVSQPEKPAQSSPGVQPPV